MNRFTRLATQAVVLVMILFLFSKAGWGQTAASPQSRFYAKNIKRIDSFNLFLRTWCDSVIPATVKEKSVKEDKENIRYISKIYNTAMSYKDFVQDAKKEELVRPHAMRAGLV